MCKGKEVGGSRERFINCRRFGTLEGGCMRRFVEVGDGELMGFRYFKSWCLRELNDFCLCAILGRVFYFFVSYFLCLFLWIE